MKKIYLLMSIMLLFSAAIRAQTPRLTGQIKNSKGEVVPFATISVKGTGNAVSADQNGNFSIAAPQGSTLIISSASFQTIEIPVGNRTIIPVTLSNESTLQEVVVTALGVSRSKERLGYSATTFRPEDITRTAPVSPLDALQGKVAGADISTIGGQPGSSSKIILRGYSSLQGNNQALIVVDGVPFNNSRPGSGTRGDPNLLNAQGGNDFGNGLNDLNPNDIESITILKGAAATSLYGSRAQNGVVLVTTKKGKAGKLKVDFTSSVVVSSVGRLPEFQNTWGQGWNGLNYKEENGSWGPKLDGKDRLWGSVVDNSRLIKPFSAEKNNLRDFYDNGLEVSNSISLKGGNDNANFLFSYGNVNSDGIIPFSNDSYKRNTMSLRGQLKASDKFVINSSFNYLNKNSRTVSTDEDAAGASTFEDILQVGRNIPITDFKDYKNKFFNVDNFYSPYTANPYFLIAENGNRYASDRFFGNVDLNYFLNKTFNVQWRTGVDFTNSRFKDWQAVEAPKVGSWRGESPTNDEGASYSTKVGGLTEQSNYVGEYNSDLFLNINHDITSDLKVSGFVGGNFNQRETRRQRSRITELTIPGFYNLSNSANLAASEGVLSKRRLFGAYAQANFEYKDFLYLALNARNDWSSTLPKDSRSFFYPGANLSLVLSKLIDLSGAKVDYLKLRTAYGKTGNDADPYLLESVLTSGDVLLGFGNIIFPLNGVPSFEISNVIGNKSLKPEITTEIEVGAEAQFFNRRLGFDLSLYRKLSDGQILNIPIPASTGYRSIVSNFGRVENKGIEITANVVPVRTKNFSWEINYTYTKNKNKVLELPEGLDKIDFSTFYDIKMVARAGQPMGVIESPTVAKTEDGRFIATETGFYSTTNNDAQFGTVQKDFIMGLNTAITYKSWRLGATLDYRKGGYMFSNTSQLSYFSGNAYQTAYNDRRPFIIPNSVVQDGVDGNGKPLYVENTTPIDVTNYNSYWYQTSNKGFGLNNVILPKTFIKLRDITLSYSLPKMISDKIKAQYVTLTAIGRNFLIWTPKKNSFIDPEVSDISNDFLGEFGELAASPATKSYGFALKIGF
ncbi:MAG: SusC/RagA family TonB-linked outer membrane protein [Flavitalea sp.]